MAFEHWVFIVSQGVLTLLFISLWLVWGCPMAGDKCGNMESFESLLRRWEKALKFVGLGLTSVSLLLFYFQMGEIFLSLYR